MSIPPALTSALGALGNKETAKALESAFKDLKSISDRAGDITLFTQAINDVMSAISPFILPMQLLALELKADTLKASLDASKDLVALLRDPDTQALIKVLGTIIKEILEFIGDVAVVIKDVDFAQKRLEIRAWFINVFDSPREAFELAKGKLDLAIQNAVHAITQPFDTVKTIIDTTMSTIESAITAPFQRIETVIKNAAQAVTDAWNQINIFNK